jgi:hypothetical protein
MAFERCENLITNDTNLGELLRVSRRTSRYEPGHFGLTGEHGVPFTKESSKCMERGAISEEGAIRFIRVIRDQLFPGLNARVPNPAPKSPITS